VGSVGAAGGLVGAEGYRALGWLFCSVLVISRGGHLGKVQGGVVGWGVWRGGGGWRLGKGPSRNGFGGWGGRGGEGGGVVGLEGQAWWREHRVVLVGWGVRGVGGEEGVGEGGVSGLVGWGGGVVACGAKFQTGVAETGCCWGVLFKVGGLRL